MRPLILRLLPLACAAVVAFPAAAAASPTPKIASVAPLKLGIGARLTIRGSGFLPGNRRNTVVFKAAGAPAVTVRATAATSRTLIVEVPAKLRSVLPAGGGRSIARRFQLRIRARRLSRSYTPAFRSPVIVVPPTTTSRAPVTPSPAGGQASSPVVRPTVPAPPKGGRAPVPATGVPVAAPAPVAGMTVAEGTAPDCASLAAPGTFWPLDLESGTFANWPELHLSGDSAIVDATDPRVPGGAPASKVAMLVAAKDPLGGNDARSSIQQKFSVKPDDWDRYHQHGTPGTSGYYIDPYPAEWLGRDGVDGMERFVRESFAVPAGSSLPPGTIVADWHARWGVNIVLRTAADGSGAWELVVRGGRFEFAPVDPATGKPKYPSWATKNTAPYWAPYTVAGVGTFAQEYQRIYRAVAPISPGQWETLTWHITYSADPAQGQLELWWNGKLVHAAHEPTLYRLIGSPQPAANADGVKPVYHQLQAYQPGVAATNPPQRIFAAPKDLAAQSLSGC